MKKPRLFIAVPLCCVLCLLLNYCGDSSSGPSHVPAWAKYIGTWSNVDSLTLTITKVIISHDLDSFVVHMYGKCHPIDCDWGEKRAPIAEENLDTILVVWNFGYSILNQKITVDFDRTLRVWTSVHYLDNSGRQDFEMEDFFTEHRSITVSNPVNRVTHSSAVGLYDL